MRPVLCLLLAVPWAWAQQSTVSRSAQARISAASLGDLSGSLEALASQVGRSVVQIFSSGYALGAEQSGNAALVTLQHSTGSGVILSADGYIVTNGHVVANAHRVRVRLPVESNGSLPQPGGKIVEARVVGIARDCDIAVLKIDRTGLDHLTLGDSDVLRQGQLVMAFGSPLGLENSVSMGVVSSVARQLKKDDHMMYIQTDAPINPGNSGGPLVDAEGRVVGINTLILSQSGGSEGLGFAIPSNIIRNVYEQIRENGHAHRGEIGVYAQTVTPELAAGLRLPQEWGVLLSDVTPEGPGATAGLKVGDILLSVNGKPLSEAVQLNAYLYHFAMGSKVTVAVLRGTDRLEYPVEVAVRDDDPQRFADMVDPRKNLVSKLGILGIEIDQKVAAILPELRNEYGILVAARAADARYVGDALELGDVIYSVNGTPVTSLDALRKAMDGLKETDPLVLQVERDGRLMYLTLEM